MELMREMEESLGCDINQIVISRTEVICENSITFPPIKRTEYNCKVIIE